MEEYKRDIVKMLDQLDNEEYIKYIYVLLREYPKVCVNLQTDVR